MKLLKYFLALFAVLAGGAINVNAALGDTFTATTTEGVLVTYKVLTEDGTTGTVQVGNGSQTSGDQAIDYNTQGAITIPSTVTRVVDDVTYTYTVTHIGYSAFYNCPYFTSVTIPSTVTTIYNAAFHNCKTGLTVYITDLEAWCNISFAGATSNPLNCQGELFLNGTLVTDVVVPEGISSIKDYAFYNYKNLASIKIPSTVTSIGYSAFYESTLWSMTFAPGSQLATIGASAFEKTSLGTICIPSTVTSIGAKAFQTNYAWTTVFCCAPNVPSTSTSTFNESWNKPMNCPLIYPYGSDYSSWINYFGFVQHGAEYMKDGIVYQYWQEGTQPANAVVKKVTSDAIVDGVVTIPESFIVPGMAVSTFVRYIMEGAFEGQGSNISKVYFNMPTPATLVMDAFKGLTDDCEFYVQPGRKTAYETAWGRDVIVDVPLGHMFQANVTVTNDGVTSQVPMWFRVTDKENMEVQVGLNYNTGDNYSSAIDSNTPGAVEIPSSVTYEGYEFAVTAISRHAFYSCGLLTQITAPSSITTIANYAVDDCWALRRFYMLRDTPPTIDYQPFYNYNSDECILVVPQGKKESYAAWNPFFINIKEVGHETDVEVGDKFKVEVDGNYVPFRILANGGENGYTVQIGKRLYSNTNPLGEDESTPSVFEKGDNPSTFAIPSTVSYRGQDYTVTAIGAYALSIFTEGDIELPSTITTIGYNAFNSSCWPHKFYCNSTTPPSFVGNNIPFQHYVDDETGAVDYAWYSERSTMLFVPSGCVDNYSSWSDYFYKISGPIKKVMICGQEYAIAGGEAEIDLGAGNGTATISWEYEELSGGGMVAPTSVSAPRRVRKNSNGEGALVPVLTLEDATINYTGNGSAIEVNSYERFYIRLLGENTITASNASAAISIGTLDGEDYGETSLVILNGDDKGSDEQPSLIITNSTTDGDGIYIYRGSFDAQDCAVDVTGSNYGLRYYFEEVIPKAPRHDAKSAPKKVTPPSDEYNNTNFYPGFMNIYGAQLELHGDQAALWGSTGYYYYSNGLTYVPGYLQGVVLTGSDKSTYESNPNYTAIEGPLFFPTGSGDYNGSYYIGCEKSDKDYDIFPCKYLKFGIIPHVVINGKVYTHDATINETMSINWEYDNSRGMDVPVLTMNNAIINYTGEGPAIEVNNYPFFYIRLRGENTITAANANAAISIGTALGENYKDYDYETSLIILNDDEVMSGEGSDELASLTVSNNKTGGDGIYIYYGSFNVQNCSVDVTGSSYGLRFYFEEEQGYSSKAPRYQARQKRGPRKVAAPNGPVDYAGYMSVYEGSELTLHGNEAALWGMNGYYLPNVGVVESDLYVYKTQSSYSPSLESLDLRYDEYGTYEIWIPNDNGDWDVKYAKLMQIAPNVMYANATGQDGQNVEMMFTIVSKSEGAVKVGDDNWNPAISKSYSGPITIPAQVNGYDVVGIAGEAFYECGITSVTFPETEKFSWIDGYAFESSAIQIVTIPDNVTRLGWDAFEECTSLTSATIGEGITSLQSWTFYGCTSLEEVNLPSGLKSIGYNDFYNCSSLSSIKIPNSVNSIGQYAFQNCRNLTEVTSEAVMPPSLMDQSFSNIGSNAVLYVPYGCYNKYNSDELYWKNFFIIRSEKDDNADMVTIEPEDEYVVVFGVDMTMDDGQGNTTALDLENAVAGGVYYNLVSDDDETNGVDTEEGCIVINTTTSEEDMADIVDSELRSEVMQEKFRGLIVEVNGKGTVKIDCMTVGSGTLAVRIGADGEANPYQQGERGEISVDFDVDEPTCIYIYASDMTVSNSVKGYRMEGVRRANDRGEGAPGVMIYQLKVEEYVPVYNIEIAGKMVTGENASNFICEGLQSGTISFDPQTYTLTLNNVVLFGASIKMNGFTADEDVQHLTINLVGNNVIPTYGNPFYVWPSYDEHLNPQSPFVDLTFTSTEGNGSLTTYSYNDDNWEIGGTWVLEGVKKLTIDHCQVGGGIINAESIVVQNGAMLATSDKIYSPVTCGEGVSYRGYTNGLYVYGPNEFIITEPVTIGQYGMATFCSLNDLNFTDVDGLKAYIVSGFNPDSQTLTLTRVYNVPAGTGVVLYGDAGDYVIPVEATNHSYANMLVGCTEDKDIQPTSTVTVTEDGVTTEITYTNFVMSVKDGTAGFYRFTVNEGGSRTIQAGKAYLRIKSSDLAQISSTIKGFSIVFNDDEPTGIADMEGGIEKIENIEIYNLAGQRMSKLQRGVNIVNGKKVLVK